MDETTRSLNFIEAIVENDIKNGVNDGRVQTRFPPEPNGYLHIGHAKAICMDFGIAQRYGGVCNLRFDDTNPVKEDVEYVDSIMEDIRWLGYQWGNVYYASDYFQQLHDLAIRLIREGKAYVDEQTAEQIAEQKGTPTQPGVESPYRNRPVEENLELFRRMNAGEVADGSMVLRAKIDMANPNMHFRDPIMYRVITSHPHHRTGTTWKAYPMYDFAHGQSDYFEGVTHSICTLEFVVHRPLYDWFIDQFADTDYRPRQYEFNRLNITYTVMSKRKMLQLVQEGAVAGWDDPRMPTICGLRRRGYTPEAIHSFIDLIGYTKVEGMIDVGLLEHCCRENLKATTPRVMAIMKPLPLIIDNYPEGQTEFLTLENNPDNPELGSRQIPFGRELFIEEGDFMEDAPKSFYRLSPGREVRLKGACIVVCTGCDKDAEGRVTAVHCDMIPNTRTGEPDCNRKVKSTINWVEQGSCVTAQVRLYDRLFSEENPAAYEGDFHDLLNPDSLTVVNDVKLEASLAAAEPMQRFQFQKTGYFCVDKDSTPGHLVFNRTVSLKDNNYK